MYKYLFHKKLAQICTNLPLTASRHKYVQQNLSLSPWKLVQICSDLFPLVSWYKYVQHKSLSLCRPVQISANPSLTGNQHQSVPFSSLPGSWYKYTQISIPREVGPSLRLSLSMSSQPHSLYGHLSLSLSTSITASLSLRTSPPRSLYALSSPLSSRPSQPLSCPLSAQHLHKRA